MATITKEQKKQILIDTANHIISRDDTSLYSENLRELARIALASLEAVPVAYLNRFTGRSFELEQQPGADKDPGVYIPLYAALPSPVLSAEICNGIKAEAMAELLKDAHDYAPLTAGQWETLVNNWHQTFMGLSGEGDSCAAAGGQQ